MLGAAPRIGQGAEAAVATTDDRHRLIDHDWALNQKIADLQEIVQPQLVAIDAITAGQGRMLTPIPFDMNLVILGDNQVAVDAVCARIIGLDPAEIEQAGAAGGLLTDLAGSVPGIDEAMSFAEVLKLVQSLDYETVVFDTAPTGHTLRLLHLPDALEQGLGKLLGMTQGLGGMVAQIGQMMGLPGLENVEDLMERFKEMKVRFAHARARASQGAAPPPLPRGL